jgi:flagellin-specific chaperone FliS
MPTHEVVVTCNKLAMTSLSSENYKECHLFLKRAEALVTALKEKLLQNVNPQQMEQVQKLYSLTMNNLGCYYKK